MLWNEEENLGWCPQVPNTRLMDNITLIFAVLGISLKRGRRVYLCRYEHSSRFPGSPGRMAYVPPAWSIFFSHVRGVQPWMCNAIKLSGGVWEGGGFVFRHKRLAVLLSFPSWCTQGLASECESTNRWCGLSRSWGLNWNASAELMYTLCPIPSLLPGGEGR